MQRSRSRNHSLAEFSSYLIRRGTKIVAVICECACDHSSPANKPWFLNTATYLKRGSFFKSAMREAHTHRTRSISSSLSCDIFLSWCGVSTTTSCAPMAPILSYMPSATRPGSPSMRYSGSGCATTRTCQVPSAGQVRIAGIFSTVPGSKGHGCGESPDDSRCPRTTQLWVMGSRRISMPDSSAKAVRRAQRPQTNPNQHPQPLENRSAAPFVFYVHEGVVSVASQELSSKRVLCSRDMDTDVRFMQQALE